MARDFWIITFHSTPAPAFAFSAITPSACYTGIGWQDNPHCGFVVATAWVIMYTCSASKKKPPSLVKTSVLKSNWFRPISRLRSSLRSAFRCSFPGILTQMKSASNSFELRQITPPQLQFSKLASVPLRVVFLPSYCKNLLPDLPKMISRITTIRFV